MNLSALSDRELLEASVRAVLALEQTVQTLAVEVSGCTEAVRQLSIESRATAGRVDALIEDTREDRARTRRELVFARGRIEELESVAAE